MPTPARPTWRVELRDAITPRAGVLLVAVALLQVSFIWSYVAAFHRPTPHRVPVAVVVAGPTASAATSLISGLNAIAGTPLWATATPSAALGRTALADRTAFGVLSVNSPTVLGVTIDSAAGPSAATAVLAVLHRAATARHAQLQVVNLRAPDANDRNGLASFYLVVGWVVGGYLAASLLGISSGSRPSTPRRAAIRLAALGLYAIATGIAGAFLVGPVLHVLPVSVGALWWLGALVVAASAATTMGLMVAFDALGIGVVILLFVVLGNPSAGGPYAWSLLPPLWRIIGPWLPNGAGTDAARSISYLGGAAIGRDLAVLSAYLLLGVLVTFVIVGVTKRPVLELPEPLEWDLVASAEDTEA